MMTTQMDVKRIGEQVKAASEPFDKLREEIHRVIVGQDNLIHKMMVGLLANGHILTEGVPGLAKTTAVRCFADRVMARYEGRVRRARGLRRRSPRDPLLLRTDCWPRARFPSSGGHPPTICGMTWTSASGGMGSSQAS